MAAVKPILLSNHAAAGETSDAEAGLARQFHRYMYLMREVEDRIERKLYRQGKVVGGVYVGRGQEAIRVGAAMVAEIDDMLFPSHRDMAAVPAFAASSRARSSRSTWAASAASPAAATATCTWAT